MRAEELVALASAHGVDLLQSARLGAPPAKRDTVARGHNGHRHTVLLEPSPQRANGTATRSSSRHEWSMAELGQAAQGVPPMAFAAACYSYAGDRSVYWKLWSALAHTAQELRARYRWPAQVRGPSGAPHFYLEGLAQLVLDEDAHPALFAAAPVLYAACVDVDEHTWRAQVFERFDQVRLRFMQWVGDAMIIMQPRLEELVDDGD